MAWDGPRAARGAPWIAQRTTARPRARGGAGSKARWSEDELDEADDGYVRRRLVHAGRQRGALRGAPGRGGEAEGHGGGRRGGVDAGARAGGDRGAPVGGCDAEAVVAAGG